MTANGHFAYGEMMLQSLRSMLETFLRGVRPATQQAYTLADPEWWALRGRVPFMARLSPGELDLLRERIGEFLARKEFKGIDIALESWQRQLIAAYACLPVLRLGINGYREWKTVIVYPDTFAPKQEWVDEAGVHHQAVVPQAGEAWEQGPVVLSWNDIAADGAVIVHEMVHTLDAGNGDVNGFPPLPGAMSAAAWTDAFSEAYERLQRDIGDGEDPVIDPYAATDPAEFLAVVSEYFFFSPAYLRDALPAVYVLLSEYFGLEPHRWADEIPTGVPGTGGE